MAVRRGRLERVTLGGWVGIALTTALLVVLTWRPALRGLGTYLIVDDSLRQADAVVVLSGDANRTRLDAAAAVARRGMTEWVIVLTAAPRNSLHDASAVRRDAALRGIDVDRVIIAGPAHSTADDARLAAEAMRQHGWRTAIVVTSPYHTRRAQWTFHRVWDALGLAFTVHASQPPGFDPGWWWANGGSMRAVVLEYVKFAIYLLRY